MSLRTRVVVVMLLLTTLTAAVTGVAVVWVVRDWVYQDAQEDALATFKDSADNYRLSGSSLADPLPGERAMDAAAERPQWPFTIIRDGVVVQQGRVRIGDIPASMRDYLAQHPSQYRFERRSAGMLLVGHSMTRPGSTAAPELLFEEIPMDRVVQRLRNMTILVVAAVVVAAVGSGVVGLLAARWLTNPLRRVQTVAEAVAGGDSAARLPQQSATELRALSRSFNSMLERHHESLEVLRSQDERSRRFVSDVSHELRSPLAALVPAAEVLREEVDALDGAEREAPALRRAAHLVADQVDALAAMVDDLLEMTRLDAGVAEVHAEPVDLMAALRSAFAARAWTGIAVHGPEEVWLTTDPRRAVTVLTNLVGNALRHGEPPVEVVVESSSGDPVLRIAVRDRGSGVPDGQEAAVFERLQKAQSARSRTVGSGAGLGLAIARDNARLLGGDVSYHREDGATVFRAWFADREGA